MILRPKCYFYRVLFPAGEMEAQVSQAGSQEHTASEE